MSAVPGSSRPDIQGEDNPNAVFTWEIVRTIRRRYVDDSAGCKRLAAEYGVSRPTIRRIIRNESWVDPHYTPPARISLGDDFAHRPAGEGEVHSPAALTWEIVCRIREERAADNTLTYRALGARYGVSLSAIQLIIRNERWVDREYTPPPPRSYNRPR